MLSAALGNVLDRNRPAPLRQLITRYQDKKWLTFSDNEDLGTLPGNRTIYGEFNVEPLRIRVSSKLEQWSPRYRFTLAHEIGHFVLHRKLIGKGKFISREQIPRDSAHQLKYREMETLSDLGWVEWQANEFALALTLPIMALSKKIRQQQENLGISRNKGVIYLDDQPKNSINARRIVSSLARDFQIPRVFCWKRLRHLDLLQDKRKIKTTHGIIDTSFIN